MSSTTGRGLQGGGAGNEGSGYHASAFGVMPSGGSRRTNGAWMRSGTARNGAARTGRFTVDPDRTSWNQPSAAYCGC